MKRYLFALLALAGAAFSGFAFISALDHSDLVSRILRQGIYGCIGGVCIIAYLAAARASSSDTHRDGSELK